MGQLYALRQSQSEARPDSECHLLRQIIPGSRLPIAYEQDVQPAAEFYRDALIASGNGLWIWDFTSGTMVWDRHACTLTGQKPDDDALDWQGLTELIHPLERHAVVHAITLKALTGQPFQVELRLASGNGTWRWLEMRGGVSASQEGQPVQLAGSLSDISERKAAEHELGLSAIAFDAWEGMMITDPAARILRVNPSFTRVTGYLPEDVLGKTPLLLQSGRHDAAFYRRMRETLELEGHWQGEIWNRRKSGEIYPEWLSITAVKAADGRLQHYLGCFSDITEQKAAEARIHDLAFYDSLTSLPNRQFAGLRIADAIARARRHDGRLALLVLDLDDFKRINEVLGHPSGDLLLQDAAQRLQMLVREEDMLARLGGDELLVVMEDLTRERDAGVLADKLNRALRTPCVVDGKELFLTASIGIAVFPADGSNADSLLAHADAALFRAKREGRDCFRFYTPAMTQQAAERLALEADLRRAIEKHELVLHYQPQIDLASGRIVGVEALVRWQHPLAGLIPPANFIALAETTGLIVPLGEQVLRQACAQMRRWLDAGLALEYVAVNVSGVQVQRADMLALVGATLAETGLAPQHLELEVTESCVMDAASQGVLQQLRDLGVVLAIDDFGTGFSSLAYLKRLPIQRLKVDRAFVSGLPNDVQDAAITQAIITLATHMDLITVAEGVETESQLAYLKQIGCSRAQGYLISRPLAVNQFEQWLASEECALPT